MEEGSEKRWVVGMGRRKQDMYLGGMHCFGAVLCGYICVWEVWVLSKVPLSLLESECLVMKLKVATVQMVVLYRAYHNREMWSLVAG